MTDGWEAHLEQHAAIGAVFDVEAWERLMAATERGEEAVRTGAIQLIVQLEALRGAVTEQQAQVVALLHALGQTAAPTDLRTGPAAPSMFWDDGVYDLRQHLVAADAAADEARLRAGLQPRTYAPDDWTAQGWHAVCMLYEALTVGVPLQPLRAAQSVPVVPGEAVYFDEQLISGSFLIDQHHRDPAELLWLAGSVDPGDFTAPTWKSCRAVLTDRRTMYLIDDAWQAHRHADGVEMAPDVVRSSMVVRHPEHAPRMLRGRGASSFAVILATLLHGMRGLAMPAFAPLVMAAAARRRAADGT